MESSLYSPQRWVDGALTKLGSDRESSEAVPVPLPCGTVLCATRRSERAYVLQGGMKTPELAPTQIF
jgi:hypothetical protein